jgi:hypothetical protein
MSATLTIRLIRSFEYRTVRQVIFHDVNLKEEGVTDLLKRIRDRIQQDTNLKIFRQSDLGG